MKILKFLSEDLTVCQSESPNENQASLSAVILNSEKLTHPTVQCTVYCTVYIVHCAWSYGVRIGYDAKIQIIFGTVYLD